MAGLGDFLEASTSRLRPKLSDSEIVSIWEYVAQYIEQQLLAEKGVTVGGFGTFAFARKSLHVGNGVLVVQRPVFNLSAQLMQSFQLRAAKHHTTGNVQVVPLNFSAIAMDSPYSRDLVQQVVEYISHEVPRALHEKKKVELLVNGVGRLYIHNSEVKFRFFREFLNVLDDSGKVEQVFRLDTRGPVSNLSVMSRMNAATSHSRSKSTVVLPKLVSRTSRSSSLPAIVSDFNAIGEENGDCAADKSGEPRQAGQPSPVPPKQYGTPSLEASGTAQGVDQRTQGGKGASKSPSPDAGQTESPCTHKKSGQELCYLCYQRARRNVPVSFDKEKRDQERLENHLLNDYQRHQQELHFARERACAMRARTYARDAQQYNWEVALEKKEEKVAQPIHGSAFLMHNRPMSPPGVVLVSEYRQGLKEQMRHKQQQGQEEERERQIGERLEQIRLSEQLASSEKAYAEKKKKQTVEYQESLKYQMENKAELVPAFEPDSKGPVFGKRDRRVEHQKDREIAERIMKEQKALSQLKAKQHRRSLEEDKERDRVMLRRARDDLLLDLKNESDIRASVANDLVTSWLAEKQLKKRRDTVERLAQRETGGQLLEQCVEYSRCDQCQRDPQVGAGTSHALKDGTYMAGFTAFV